MWDRGSFVQSSLSRATEKLNRIWVVENNNRFSALAVGVSRPVSSCTSLERRSVHLVYVRLFGHFSPFRHRSIECRRKV